MLVAIKEVRRDMERKVDQREELELERVQLCCGYTSNSGIVCVVVIRIVKELGSDHDGRDEETVDVERGEQKTRVLLDDAIEVDYRKHKTLGAAVSILDKPFEVGLDRNGWGA